MNTSYQVISSNELEHFIRHPTLCHEEKSWLICTVMELLQVAENAKKARGKLDWLQFTEGWPNIKEQIHVEPLDRDCLRRSLFTHSEENQHLVTGLWPEVLDRKRPPEHTVRRLIFRPSEETIWDEQNYENMEKQYKE